MKEGVPANELPQLSVRVTPAFHRRFRLTAVKHGTTTQEVLHELVEKWVQQKEKKK